ncbi:ABC transporter transmembrane region 2-domain-containing protein [Cunninghamella echinulata]|nr:ABC transporter transmembrane region 2-domain-containing protein [Cunninghamella echinulata]
MPATYSKPIDSWLGSTLKQKQVYSTLAVAIATVSAFLSYQRKQQQIKKNNNNNSKSPIPENDDKVFDQHKHLFPVTEGINKVGVNDEFKRQLKALATVLFPSWHTKEAGLLVLHSIFLILRTYLSVVVARLDGRIVKDLVNGNGKKFLIGLGYWFAIALPATYTNSMIRYLQSKLSIGFRTRLTRYAHDLYLDKEKTFYKAVNLDNRIQGTDQFITTDIAKFCDTLSSLYSNLAKPLLDTIIFNYQLTRSIGLLGTFGLAINYVVTAKLLRAVTPSFGKLAAIEAKLEGDFRNAHTRLITNAEEIAFYNGAELEHTILNKAYLKLIKHINHIYKLRISYNMFEDFLIKYAWGAFGLIMCGIPVFVPGISGSGPSSSSDNTSSSSVIGSRTRSFITNKRLMLSLADAGGRMMYSYKELAELAGYTSRVYSLISVLHALRKKQYDGPEDKRKYALTNIEGQIHTTDAKNGILFDKVPIVVPTPGKNMVGEVLVNPLEIHVKPGQHLMITGPNGVGKTAVARVIASLWPTFEGDLSKPEDRDIFYIAQRPYLSLGTLRDQIIYPHTAEQMKKAGRTDDELMKILEVVHLAYIPGREGGWETQKEWKDVFSGGEKQRIGMARLFYHHPQYAVLDECTSAVSVDVEGLMYSHAKDMGISK